MGSSSVTVGMVVRSCIPFGSRTRIWVCSNSASFTRNPKQSIQRKLLPYHSWVISRVSPPIWRSTHSTSVDESTVSQPGRRNSSTAADHGPGREVCFSVEAFQPRCIILSRLNIAKYTVMWRVMQWLGTSYTCLHKG